MTIKLVFEEVKAAVEKALAEAAEVATQADIREWCRAAYDPYDTASRSSGEPYLERIWPERFSGDRKVSRQAVTVEAALKEIRGVARRVGDNGHVRGVRVPSLEEMRKLGVGGAILAARELARSINATESDELRFRANYLAEMAFPVARAARFRAAQERR